MDLTGIGSVADLLKTGINKIWPDPAQAAAAKVAIMQAEQAGALKEMDDQFQLNIGPLGCTLNFQVSGPNPVAPGSPPPVERVATIRLSLQHLIHCPRSQRMLPPTRIAPGDAVRDGQVFPAEVDHVVFRRGIAERIKELAPDHIRGRAQFRKTRRIEFQQVAILEPVFNDTNGNVTFVMTPINAPLKANPASWAPFYVPVHPVSASPFVGTLQCTHIPADNCPDHGPLIAGAAASIEPSVYGAAGQRW